MFEQHPAFLYASVGVDLRRRLHKALLVKTPHEGSVDNRAAYSAIGMDMEGHKEILGLWMRGNDRFRHCVQVLTELRNPGVRVTVSNGMLRSAHVQNITSLNSYPRTAGQDKEAYSSTELLPVP